MARKKSETAATPELSESEIAEIVEAGELYAEQLGKTPASSRKKTLKKIVANAFKADQAERKQALKEVLTPILVKLGLTVVEGAIANAKA